MLSKHTEGSELEVLVGHTAPVEAVVFSPDGGIVASMGRDGRIVYWEVETGTILRQRDAGHAPRSIAFSPDGRTLITAEHGVRLWNAETGPWEGTVPNGSDLAVFSSDGSQLLTVSAREVQWLDRESGQLQRHFAYGEGVQFQPDFAAISLDRGTLALGTFDAGRDLLYAWDLHSGALTLKRRIPRSLWWKTRDPGTGKLRKRWGAQADLRCLALSPCGRRLAVGGSATLWLCDTRTGRRTHLLLCGQDGCLSAAFSPDGSLLATGLRSGNVALWRIPSGEQVWGITAHDGWVSAVAFSPDGRVLASGGHDKAVKLWNVGTGFPHRSFPALSFEALALAYSPDGSRIAVSYTDECIRLWNVRTARMEHALTGVPPYARSLAFSGDGRHLSLSSPTLDADWDVDTGSLLRAQPKVDDSGTASGPLGCEAVSPGGRIAAVSHGWEGRIELRTPDFQQVLKVLPEIDEPDGVVELIFSPDGAVLAAGYMGFRVRLWDVETGRLIQKMRSHGDVNSSLAFSPDGSLLAVGGDYDTQVVLCNLRAETRPVRMVMTAEERLDLDWYAELFGVSRDELPDEEVTLAGHTGNIRGVAFSPDGNTVATVATDAALKLWDPATGRLRATLTPLPSSEEGPAEEWIAYTPEGHYVASPGAHLCIHRKSATEAPVSCSGHPAPTWS